jgi:hypothetical protein
MMMSQRDGHMTTPFVLNGQLLGLSVAHRQLYKLIGLPGSPLH